MADGTLADHNVFKWSVVWRASNQLCQTGGFLRDMVLDDNSPADVANAIKPWVDTKFKTILLSIDSLVKIDVTKLGSEDGFTYDYVATAGGLGVAGVAPLPTFVTANVALKTNRRKRYGQGRMLWPVRDENMVTGDELIAGAVATYQGIIDDFVSRFVGGPLFTDLHAVAYHDTIPELPARGTRPLRAPIPAHWYDVSVLKLNTFVGSLRSRKVGVGS